MIIALYLLKQQPSSPQHAGQLVSEHDEAHSVFAVFFSLVLLAMAATPAIISKPAAYINMVFIFCLF